MSAAPKQLSPRAKAIRRLHAVAARRGLAHDDLRQVCGVQSLTQLTTDQLHEHATRIEQDRPAARRRGRGPLQPGEVRLAGDATSAQREAIEKLLRALGWWNGPTTLARGIRGLHAIPDLYKSHLDRRDASDLISQLGRALHQQNRDRKRAAPDPGTEPTEVST